MKLAIIFIALTTHAFIVCMETTSQYPPKQQAMILLFCDIDKNFYAAIPQDIKTMIVTPFLDDYQWWGVHNSFNAEESKDKVYEWNTKICFNNDSTLLATHALSRDTTHFAQQIFDIPKHKKNHSDTQKSYSPIDFMHLSNNDDNIITQGRYRIKLHDTLKQKCYEIYPQEDILTMCLNKTETLLAIGIQSPSFFKEKIHIYSAPITANKPFPLVSFDCESTISSLCFNHNDTQLIVGLQGGNLYAIIYDLTGKKIKSIPYADRSYTLYSTSCNYNGTLLLSISGSGNGKYFCTYKNTRTQVLDLTGNQILNIPHDTHVTTASLINKGTLLAIKTQKYIQIFNLKGEQVFSLLNNKFLSELSPVCFDKNSTQVAINCGSKTKIIKAYNYSLEQLLFKRITQLFLQVQKPNKLITTMEILYSEISQLFNLNKSELQQTWLTFPKYMQISLWKSMRKKIQKYGKHKI